MKKTIVILALLLSTIGAAAQGVIKGKAIDKITEEPLSFVNVKVTPQGSEKIVGGGMSDIDGQFSINIPENGKYTLTLTYVGYKDLTRQVEISKEHSTASFSRLYMSEDAHTLKEVTVTGQRSTMKLEVDRKIFEVGQLINNAGQAASDVLENIPSVEVDNDGNVSLRGNTSVEVWINGKASGLTADNRAQILQQIPAESIDRIEVIDNPSAKFSAEGSAGIINIILKKDHEPGYYGSVQVGGTTRKGGNTSANINYSSSAIDAYANIGYRHRANRGRSESEQEYLATNEYQNYVGRTNNQGNNLFSRAGFTWHITEKDDFTLGGMMMIGGGKNTGDTPYHYGTIGAPADSKLMTRHTRSSNRAHMLNGEIGYKHSFSDTHFIDLTFNANKWSMDGDNYYQDSTYYYVDKDGYDAGTVVYDYQYRPMDINNHRSEVKADYENNISEKWQIQAGYQGNFSHENTPQQSFIDNTSWDGRNATEDKLFFNRFIYDLDIHAFYLTNTLNFGKLGVMAGLRGEYWKVNTESYTWDQEYDPSLREKPFKKDYFKLFPSVFMSYQITENDQLQLNYTRRLRRPWGGQLNSFRDTRDATMISFGNPQLTPEYSNSFSLNYLKTWTQHSLLVSAYYRPTTDVIQRINWQSTEDGMMYSTSKNVAKSQSSGIEATLKNKFWNILDLTTNANAYYYKLDGFKYVIDGQEITGEENHSFTWNARMTASVILPYDISIQANTNYRSRQAITQGHRKANCSMDLGARKNFLNKKFTLSINCRDLFNSRRWETFTSSDTFTRHQLNKRGGRNIICTLTWNFGNNPYKKDQREGEQNNGNDDNGGFEGGGE